MITMNKPKYVATKYGDATYLVQLVPISGGQEVKDDFTKATVIAVDEEQAIAIIEDYRNRLSKRIHK